MKGPRTGAGRVLFALATLALSTQVFSGTARADDPNDRMSPEDIARDAAIIRKLNRDQLEYVRKRDAGYAAGWKAYDRANGGGDERYAEARDDEADYREDDYREDDYREDDYRDRRRDYAGQSRAYAQARRDYEADLAQWRRDVAACRAGDYSRCE